MHYSIFCTQCWNVVIVISPQSNSMIWTILICILLNYNFKIYTFMIYSIISYKEYVTCSSMITFYFSVLCEIIQITKLLSFGPLWVMDTLLKERYKGRENEEDDVSSCWVSVRKMYWNMKEKNTRLHFRELTLDVSTELITRQAMNDCRLEWM
jgi:hypothetical protein